MRADGDYVLKPFVHVSRKESPLSEPSHRFTSSVH
jgi:hypothetical protein